MHTVELHSRGKGWQADSLGAHGDDTSDSGFGKIQAADSADMRRMGKKQQFRVCKTRELPPVFLRTDRMDSAISMSFPSPASVWLS